MGLTAIKTTLAANFCTHLAEHYLCVYLSTDSPASLAITFLLSMIFHHVVQNLNISTISMFLQLTLTRNLDSIYDLLQSSILLKDKLDLPNTKTNQSQLPPK